MGGRQMMPFLAKRVLWFAPTILAISVFTFLLIRFAPGGPFDREKPLPPEIKKNIEARYGLDKPLHEQFTQYMTGLLLHGDFGPSLKYKDFSVNEIMAQSMAVSFQLGAIAFVLSLIGIPLGALAAARKNSLFDYSAMFAAMMGISLPNFVIGSLLLLVFGFTFMWLPVAGWGRPEHLILPALTLAAPYVAYIARLVRASLLEELTQDYVRTALAKGLSQPQVIARHALRNSAAPILSFLGPAAAGMVTGSVVVEKIFAIPGMGTHFINGAINRDYTLIMGVVLVYSVFILVFNLVVDILYGVVDPRIRNA